MDLKHPIDSLWMADSLNPAEIYCLTDVVPKLTERKLSQNVTDVQSSMVVRISLPQIHPADRSAVIWRA